MKRNMLALAGPVFVLAMLVVTLWMLHNELRQYHLRDFFDGLAKIPSSRLWLAVLLTCLNYVILFGYDILGVKYIGQSLHLAKVALGSFLGYAVGNNFGTLFGGSTIRFRLYSSWGLSSLEIVKLVLIVGVSFWIGVFALAGFVFLWEPLQIPSQLAFATVQHPTGRRRLVGAGGCLSGAMCCAAPTDPNWQLGLRAAADLACAVAIPSGNSRLARGVRCALRSFT